MANVRSRARNIFLRLDDSVVYYGLSMGVIVRLVSMRFPYEGWVIRISTLALDENSCILWKERRCDVSVRGPSHRRYIMGPENGFRSSSGSKQKRELIF